MVLEKGKTVLFKDHSIKGGPYINVGVFSCMVNGYSVSDEVPGNYTEAVITTEDYKIHNIFPDNIIGIIPQKEYKVEYLSSLFQKEVMDNLISDAMSKDPGLKIIEGLSK